MKITLKILTSVLVLTILFSSCKKNDPTPPSIEDQQLEKLTAAWKVSSATLGGAPQSGYENFTLTLSGTAGANSYSYSTSAGSTTLSNTPWPSNGNWNFGDDPENQIVRDKDTDKELDMTYSVSDTKLQVNFNFSGVGFPARVSNVNGDWVFEFTKQ